MLAAIGVSSFEDCWRGSRERRASAGRSRSRRGMSEEELRRLFRASARATTTPETTPSFLGAGLYDHAIPAAIRQLTLRSEFYTAYTPYQAEVAQGTLATIYEFQSIICELTGMDVANASMYDGGFRGGRGGAAGRRRDRRTRVLVSAGGPPACAAGDGDLRGRPRHRARDRAARRAGVTEPRRARARMLGRGDRRGAWCCSNPNFFGVVEPLRPPGAARRRRGRAPAARWSSRPTSFALGLLESPGALGARHRGGRGAVAAASPRSSAARSAATSRAKKELVRRHAGTPRRRDAAITTATAASCSRCRRASSTSAARRRPRTSARTTTWWRSA